MCCDAKTMKTKHEFSFKKPVFRYIAIVLFVCILLSSILSGLFVITHSNHEHDHSGSNESCATCIQLAHAENLLKQLSSAIVATALVFALSLFNLFYLKLPVHHVFTSTLVTLKVRLNN